MLSRQFYEEEQDHFRKKIGQLIDKKSGQHFAQKRPRSISEQTVQTCDIKFENNMDINTRRLERNIDYSIKLDLDRTQHQQTKKTYPSFIERNNKK